MIDAHYRTGPLEAGDGESPKITGDQYIQKIFQVQFSLPPVRVRELVDFLRATYQQAGLEPAEVVSLQHVRAHLDYLVDGASVNPREVKRYINAYLLQVDINPALVSDAVLALQTLVFRHDWNGANQALLTWRGFLIDALKRRVFAGDQTALGALGPELASLPESFIDYVAVGAPGHALLTVPDIEPYISSSEAASSRESYGLIEAMASLGRVTTTLRHKAERAASGSGPIDLSDVNLNEIGGIASLLGSDPLSKSLGDELSELSGRLTVPITTEDPMAWYTDVARTLNRVRNRIMRRYQG